MKYITKFSKINATKGLDRWPSSKDDEWGFFASEELRDIWLDYKIKSIETANIKEEDRDERIRFHYKHKHTNYTAKEFMNLDISEIKYIKIGVVMAIYEEAKTWN